MSKIRLKHVVLFHGKNREGASGPNSEKLKAIAGEAARLGLEPHIADHTMTNDPEEGVRLARAQYSGLLREGGVIFVGNSMGGYVATLLAREFAIDGLFLMAPALYRREYAVQS